MNLRRLSPPLWAGLLLAFAVGGAGAQADGPPAQTQYSVPPNVPSALPGTGFLYQGELRDGGGPVNAACDFEFRLFDAVSGGAQLGGVHTKTNVTVANGRFAALLNDASQFGPRAFDGSARWLAIDVRCPAGGGAYTNLTPRQALTASPLAFALPGLWTELTAGTPNVIGGHISNTAGAGAFALGRRRVA